MRTKCDYDTEEELPQAVREAMMAGMFGDVLAEREDRCTCVNGRECQACENWRHKHKEKKGYIQTVEDVSEKIVCTEALITLFNARVAELQQQGLLSGRVQRQLKNQKYKLGVLQQRLLVLQS